VWPNRSRDRKGAFAVEVRETRRRSWLDAGRSFTVAALTEAARSRYRWSTASVIRFPWMRKQRTGAQVLDDRTIRFRGRDILEAWTL
jgi:hypothetical protein